MGQGGRREWIARRARRRCEYCRAPQVAAVPYHLEHIIPASRRGNDDLDNLAWGRLAREPNDCFTLLRLAEVLYPETFLGPRETV